MLGLYKLCPFTICYTIRNGGPKLYDLPTIGLVVCYKANTKDSKPPSVLEESSINQSDQQLVNKDLFYSNLDNTISEACSI